MNFFFDFDTFEIDFYFQLALYLTLGGGISKFLCPLDSLWIFPSLATLEAGAASTITKWLQEALEDVQTYGSFTGTSLRVGAVNEIGAYSHILPNNFTSNLPYLNYSQPSNY